MLHNYTGNEPLIRMKHKKSLVDGTVTCMQICTKSPSLKFPSIAHFMIFIRFLKDDGPAQGCVDKIAKKLGNE